mmetsp:Transcript_19442/g.48587  ORF Transcript_19442/g.48587 Transcript_19442/m.48587 type:complete len:624 (-) Transcript_19442:18-1889(-)
MLRQLSAEEASVPEFAAWEQDKENVRPVRRGRSAATLARVMCLQRAPDSALAQGLEEERAWKRADFEARLEAAWSSAAVAGQQRDRRDEITGGSSSAAPQTAAAAAAAAAGIDEGHVDEVAEERAVFTHLVSLWCDYACWIAECFPSDSIEERKVLERATQSLANQPQCRNDARHLHLWLRLADLHREPQELFSFLWVNEIGASHAAFYETWAMHLETQQRFAEAIELLDIGLARGASPTERLLSARGGLLVRVQDRIQRHSRDVGDSAVSHGAFANDWAEDPSADAAISLGRPVLNVLTENEACLLHRPLEPRGAPAAGLGQGLGCLSSLRGHRRPFVCLDEIFGELGKHDFQVPRASIFDAQAAWLQPPASEHVARKENRRVTHQLLVPGMSLQRRLAGSCASTDGLRAEWQRQHHEGGRGSGGGCSDGSSALGLGNGSRGEAGTAVLSIYVDEECDSKPSPPAATVAAVTLNAGMQQREVAPEEPSTPPSSAQGGPTGSGHLSSVVAGDPDPSSAAPPRRAPGAPVREGRRQRRRKEDEEWPGAATSALAASFSTLRLRDEPPAKRLCPHATDGGGLSGGDSLGSKGLSGGQGAGVLGMEGGSSGPLGRTSCSRLLVFED